MFVGAGGSFQRAVLADCRGSGNHDGSGCAVDWGDFLLSTRDSCLKDFDLAIDGSGGHWAYLSLTKPSDGDCPLLPLPEHASDGTCAGGAIPHGGSCDPQCGYAVRGDTAATCETSVAPVSHSQTVSLGLWKGMCGASIALRLSSPSPCWLTSTVALRRVREGRVPHRGRHARPSVLGLPVALDDNTARCNLCHRVRVRGGL